MRKRRLVIFILGCALVGGLQGCGAPSVTPPPLYPVTGVVRDSAGKPLAACTVQFILQVPQALTMSAVTDEAGAFTLTTIFENESFTGALAGPCQVLLTPAIAENAGSELIVLPDQYVVEPRENHFVLNVERANAS